MPFVQGLPGAGVPARPDAPRGDLAAAAGILAELSKDLFVTGYGQPAWVGRLEPDGGPVRWLLTGVGRADPASLDAYPAARPPVGHALVSHLRRGAQRDLSALFKSAEERWGEPLARHRR